MTKRDTVRAIEVDGQLYQKMPGGALIPLESKTDWARVDAATDEGIKAAIAKDPDAAPLLDKEWFAKAKRYNSEPRTEPITLRLDRRVIDYFRSKGDGYQTRIKAVLAAYVDENS
jgi:uncharacterized protein (DUF4415 family)